MITEIKIATILAVLFMSNLVFAESGKPSFVIKNAGDKSFYFETKEMSSSFVEVIFEDENGKVPPRLVEIESDMVQLFMNHHLRYIKEDDYELAKKFVSNPEIYDFNKILNWI